MRSMKISFAAGVGAMLLALAMPATSQAAAMYKPEPIAIPCNTLTAQKIRGTVREAFLQRKWIVNDKGASAVEAKYIRKNTHAVVSAAWTTKAVTIKYVSSEGLSAEGDEIHKAYNKWVQNIERDIAVKLSRACG
jgi:hypothetical protein